MPKTVTVSTAAWFGDAPLDLTFPDSWDVQVCRMAGHDAPALSDGQIREALRRPLGAPPIRDLAKGRREVAVLFDDLSRPTPAHRVVPFVLEELADAGVRDEQVRFIGAFGAHLPMTRDEFSKKLGEGVVERFRVYNHNVFENLVYLGKTSFGTPVHVNREFMSCDLKLAVGGMISSWGKGRSRGGAKLVMPGVSGIETIYHNHITLPKLDDMFGGDPRGGELPEKVHIGRVDMEEVARMAGLDVKIDLIQNARREAVGAVAGDFVRVYREGSEVARRIYHTKPAEDCDVVVMNAYPQEEQPGKGMWGANLSLKEGGDLVVVAIHPKGLSLPHYLFGRFGKDYTGRGPRRGYQVHLPKARRVFLLCNAPSRTDIETFAPPEQLTVCGTWAEVEKELTADRRRPTRVAVYPCASIQGQPY
jgi:nickel-dependent lactate racemase